MRDNREKIEEVIRILISEYPQSCSRKAPLSPFTSYHVGGNADLLISPSKIEDIAHIVHLCYEKKVPFVVIGKGANVLVHDEGFRGIVVSLKKCCSRIFHEKNLLYVGAGATMQNLVEYCEKQGLPGFEDLSGITGTMGDALRTNACAFDREIGDRVVRIDAVNERGVREEISGEQALFGHCRADGLIGKTLLGCWLLVGGDNKETLDKSRQNLERRANQQPMEYPYYGSIFKQPVGDYAGRLIEKAGMKGLRIGDAMVSEKAANFVVNVDKATAKDIFEVISKVQQTVYDKFGVWLELEVRLVGFPEHQAKMVEKPQ